MKSMTGYGKAEYNQNGINITVEIKTVNSRFLDLSPKYPRCFLALEDVMRKTVQSNVVRGKADLFISFKDTRESDSLVEVDYNLASSYVEAYKNIKSKFSDINDDFSITNLMRSPDVIKPSQDMFKVEEFSGILEETILKAVGSLNVMREFEGEKLKKDLLSRVAECQNIVLKIEEFAPQVAKNYSDKIRERVEEILSNQNIDEARLLQEVAIFADKCSIDEEITRLKSHIKQFNKICEGVGEVGKKLDFLVQEFNREANTICSKSNSVEITENALKLKCEIEKIREQIQNIE